jgi:hypothetical protein
MNRPLDSGLRRNDRVGPHPGSLPVGSFRVADHLRSILEEAQSTVGDAIGISVKKES